MSQVPMYVPEESLPEVIEVIQEGLKRATVSEETREGLEEWCRSQREWLDTMQGRDEPV